MTGSGPLAGVRIVELGMMIAGPFAGRLLADLGADVIKVESPRGGDALRDWKHIHAGASLWWRVQSRNKRLVTADLRPPEGERLARGPIETPHVLIENFPPRPPQPLGPHPAGARAPPPEPLVAPLPGFRPA